MSGIDLTEAYKNMIHRLNDGVVIPITVGELKYLLDIAYHKGREDYDPDYYPEK